ncbi:MAG: hypothetical protein KJZ75_13215 [Hyphomonadaceae bacterium]|nr:hypothetical protein [Hyphomonadaceae bacterium]GIK48745.1 MAG: hypothetical protein BroJett013_14420 [Alphaproteobacteria bacterium]
MIPIYLDPGSVRIALIGRGALAARRLAWLQQGGATPEIWSDEPSEALLSASDNTLVRRLPTDAELRDYQAVWIADLPYERAELIANAARSAGVLVNVEDVAEFCDFHTPAVVRRGRLTLAAGTGGASPAVARAARERLEQAFPAAWAPALEDIARARAELRRRNAGFDALVSDARQRLAEHGLA